MFAHRKWRKAWKPKPRTRRNRIATRKKRVGYDHPREAEREVRDDPRKPLSKAQKFARFISSGTGLEMFRAIKSSRGREVEQADADSEIADVRYGFGEAGGETAGTDRYTGNTSTPMRAVSASDDAAYLDAARRLESGRAALTEAAMKPDYPSRSYRPGENEHEGGAENQARAAAARRHGRTLSAPLMSRITRMFCGKTRA